MRGCGGSTWTPSLPFMLRQRGRSGAALTSSSAGARPPAHTLITSCTSLLYGGHKLLLSTNVAVAEMLWLWLHMLPPIHPLFSAS